MASRAAAIAWLRSNVIVLWPTNSIFGTSKVHIKISLFMQRQQTSGDDLHLISEYVDFFLTIKAQAGCHLTPRPKGTDVYAVYTFNICLVSGLPCLQNLMSAKITCIAVILLYVVCRYLHLNFPFADRVLTCPSTLLLQLHRFCV